MSERWIKRCESILEQIKTLEATKDRDRLQLVHSIKFSLGALWNSLAGWINWINNPSIMTKFNQEELAEMNKTITEYTKSFIEYDLKITKRGIQKGLKERPATRRLPERQYRI